MENKMIIGIIIIIELLLFSSCICFMITYVEDDNRIYKILSIICCVLFCIIIVLGVTYNLLRPPKRIYAEKINNLNRAEKELEKFLIDYPEFKNNGVEFK